jgi:hypothetical protein
MASKAGKAARTATEALRILWEDNFFVARKKKGAIEEVLSKRGNHFTDAELGMALMRAPHLTRNGKRGSYEYIQKYPHATEVEHAATKAAKPNARKR